MNLSSPSTLMLLALAPSALLIALGVFSFKRFKAHRAIPATALASGLALVVLVLLVAAGHSLQALRFIADSKLLLFGVPLASFAVALGIFAHQCRLSVASWAACCVVGMIGLWYLGGVVLMLSACSLGLAVC